jgi:glycerol-3-phosphate dehydrogenase
VPWQRALLVGVSESPGSADATYSLPTLAEVEYLIKSVNDYSDTRKLTKKDIIAAWSGIRPSIKMSQLPGARTNKARRTIKDKAKNKDLLREQQIIQGPGGIFAAIGSDLLSYRMLAEQVVNVLTSDAGESHIDRRKAPARTKRTMLGGFKDKNDFLTRTAAIAAKARKLSLEPATVDHLIATYGTDAEFILDLVERQPLLNERICPDFPPIMAEVAFCVLNEMAVSLEDLLFRRLRLGFLHQMQCKQSAPKVAALIQNLLNWDDARTALELQAVEKTLDLHINSFLAVALTNG